DIDTDKPVSRQHEVDIHKYYNWSYYWIPNGLMPGVVLPPPVMSPAPEKESTKPGDMHLRSVRAVTGYEIESSDGKMGAVSDFIADDAVWMIRYLVVSTHKWLPGRKVLIAPNWLVGPISWEARTVKIIMSSDDIKNSPVFDPARPIGREYENSLYDYYGRPR